jgi:hypothetical protein
MGCLLCLALLPAVGAWVFKLGGTTFFLYPFALSTVGVVVLAMAVWGIATRDLGKIARGDVDMDGQKPTEIARTYAVWAVMVSSIPLTIFGTLLIQRMLSCWK